jgi:hypothetical protein
MKKSTKIAITGIVIIAVILVIYLIMTIQEEVFQEQEIRIEESPSTESFDSLIKSIKTKNPYVNQILSKCGTDAHCVVEAMWDLAEVEQEKIVLQTLSDITSVYSDAGYYCHGPAHHLGMFLYGFTNNITKTLELSSKRDCGGAMYHGGIENYFLSQVILKHENIDEIEFTEICKSLADDAKKMKRVECAHGVGHGLAKVYDYDIFQSVKRCDEFSDPTEKRLCYEGVFMENTVANQEIGGGTFDENDLFYPCDKVETKYAGACYYYHASYILAKKQKISLAFEECNKLKPEVSLIFCYIGLGRQTAPTYFDNLKQMIPICENGLEKYQKYCYQGALIIIADHRGFENSFEACRVFPDLFKMDCYTLLGDWIRIENSSKSEREKACLPSENQKYFDVCINAKI